MSYNDILKENTQVLNHEGAEAFRMSPEMELYAAVCTMALQPKFYESTNEQVERIAALIRKVKPEFVARLAVYARREMNLRSIPLLLAVELARVHSGDNLVARTIEKVVMRADEIMELLMCYQWRNPQQGIKKLAKLSHQVQSGLQRAFNKFDEYQFAKYDRDNLEVKLRDALFLVHPKAKDESQQELFNKIADKALSVPYTWETELSALGLEKFENNEAKKAAFGNKWTELITSGKLGYMALLRNLRNILETGVDDNTVKQVAKRIANVLEVKKAKQFPFRYLSAYKELKKVVSTNTSLMLSALEDAAVASAAGIPGFGNESRVMIACDMSGSMQCPLSGNSKVQYYEVGNMLAMLLQSRCEKVVSGIFADDWKVVNLPQNNVLSNTYAIGKRIGEVGYGTYGGKPLEWIIKEKIVVDKVMFFTDFEFWGEDHFGKYFSGLWNEYKKISPNAHLYLFDLAGYGHTPIKTPQEDVTLVAGWSDRVFEMLDSIENGSSVIEEINAIEL
ncbi:MAG: TROVE domain-containing protein [Muribaculaceae bacterium]|nr:TROVE domain-containing protein [Muribaculaceae bacterium]